MGQITVSHDHVMLYPKERLWQFVAWSFMMNSQELETAVRLKLNLVVLVLNDSSYGMISGSKQAWDLIGLGDNLIFLYMLNHTA